MASSDGDGENSSEDAVEDRHLRLTRVLSSDEDDDDDEAQNSRLVRTPPSLARGPGPGSGRFVLALSGFRGFSMPSGGRVGRSAPRPWRLTSVIATTRAGRSQAGRSHGGVGSARHSLGRARSRSPVLAHLTNYRSCGHLARPLTLPAFPRWHNPLVISTASSQPLASLGRDGFQRSARGGPAADEDDGMEDEALPDEDYEGEEEDEDEENTRYRLTSSDESVDMVFEVEDDAETDETAPGTAQEEEDEEAGDEDEQVDEEGAAAASDDDEEAVGEDEEEEDGEEDEDGDNEEEENENEVEEESTPGGALETDTMETEEAEDEEDGEDGDQEEEEEEDEENEEENATVTSTVAVPPEPTRVSDIPLPSSSPPSAAGPTAPPAEQPLGLVGSLLEILECPVCYEPMRPPIWQCSRGHMVCKDCAPRLKRCPTCRCTARRSRNCTMEKVCAKLQYPCRFHARGCAVTLPPGELDQHELAACAHRDSACRVPRCSWRGVDAQLRAHARAAHAALSKAGRAGAPVTMRVPVWGSAMRHCRLLDHATHVFFVHFLVDAGTLSGCVQLFGSAAQARDIEYRMELDERPGRGGRAHHQLYQHRDAMQRVADIQERINYFQARLRHSVSSESGGGGGGGGPGILEASTWTWARVLGVDEDPEHALRGGRAWRVDLGRARRLTSHSRFAKTRVRVTVQPVLRPGQ